jgi:hypothetical protein
MPVFEDKSAGSLRHSGPRRHMTEFKEGELEQLGALLKEHQIEELIAKHKPQTLDIRFNVQRLDHNALAASFPRMSTTGPYLHQLGHVIDRVKNWTRYASIDPLNYPGTLEYEADDFVAACNWRDGLIETLRLTVARGWQHGIPDGMASKRLSRLSSAV